MGAAHCLSLGCMFVISGHLVRPTNNMGYYQRAVNFIYRSPLRIEPAKNSRTLYTFWIAFGHIHGCMPTNNQRAIRTNKISYNTKLFAAISYVGRERDAMRTIYKIFEFNACCYFNELNVSMIVALVSILNLLNIHRNHQQNSNGMGEKMLSCSVQMIFCRLGISNR